MIEHTPRILRLGLLGLCGGFALIIASEIFALMPGDTAASNIARVAAGAPSAITLPENLDSAVAEILERPLFSASRTPADAPASEDNDGDGEEKKPGQIQARLTGLVIRPGASEALFERDGEKAISIKEGQQIDGWTVSSIRFDSVVLTSDSGEQTLKPSIGQGSAPVRPKKVAAKKPAPPAAAKKPNAPKAVAAAGQARR